MSITVNLDDGPGQAYEILGLEQEAEREPIRRTMEFLSHRPNQWIKTEALVPVSGLHLRGIYELMLRMVRHNDHIKFNDARGFMWESQHTPYVPPAPAEEKVEEMAKAKKYDYKRDIPRVPIPGKGTETTVDLPRRKRNGKTQVQCPVCDEWIGAAGIMHHYEYHNVLEAGGDKKTSQRESDRKYKARKRAEKATAPKVVETTAGRSLSRVVLDFFQQHPNEYITIERLRKEFPADAGTKAVGAVNGLVDKIPHMQRVRKGVYMFSSVGAPEVEVEPTVPEKEPEIEHTSLPEFTAASGMSVVRVNDNSLIVIYEGRAYMAKAID